MAVSDALFEIAHSQRPDSRIDSPRTAGVDNRRHFSVMHFDHFHSSVAGFHWTHSELCYSVSLSTFYHR